jgi:hypothetical protein
MDQTPANEIVNVEGRIEANPAAEAPPAPPAPSAPQAGAQVPAPPQAGTTIPPAAPEPPAPVAPPPPPAPTGAVPAPQTPPPVVAAPAQPKVMDPNWPFAGYTGPQPWEADNPPTLTQNHLMLSAGSSGDEVVELAALLAYLGYGTTISAGQNPHAIYDTGVSDAVRAFCADYGVEEDPKVRAARTEDTVGPWIWEALVRAVHKKIAATGS